MVMVGMSWVRSERADVLARQRGADAAVHAPGGEGFGALGKGGACGFDGGGSRAL
jgi:hypothetical protein